MFLVSFSLSCLIVFQMRMKWAIFQGKKLILDRFFFDRFGVSRTKFFSCGAVHYYHLSSRGFGHHHPLSLILPFKPGWLSQYAAVVHWCATSFHPTDLHSSNHDTECTKNGSWLSSPIGSSNSCHSSPNFFKVKGNISCLSLVEDSSHFHQSSSQLPPSHFPCKPQILLKQHWNSISEHISLKGLAPISIYTSCRFSPKVSNCGILTRARFVFVLCVEIGEGKRAVFALLRLPELWAAASWAVHLGQLQPDCT